jgi:hypothetical protein
VSDVVVVMMHRDVRDLQGDHHVFSATDVPKPWRTAANPLACRAVVATVTRARNDQEEAVLRESLSTLSALSLPVIASDGGSPDRFLEFVAHLPRVEMGRNDDVPGLVGQARRSLRRAASSGARLVAYTEPDKTAFFARGLVPFLAAAEHSGADLVLASRTAESFATYPAMQQLTEGLLNVICGRETGLSGDYSYGPFAVVPALIPLLEELPAGVGWGWRPFLFLRAHLSGYRIAVIPGEFPCPDDQRADDVSERRHRVRQLAQNLAGVQLALDM